MYTHTQLQSVIDIGREIRRDRSSVSRPHGGDGLPASPDLPSRGRIAHESVTVTNCTGVEGYWNPTAVRFGVLDPGNGYGGINEGLLDKI
jgi:hypothetical protein